MKKNKIKIGAILLITISIIFIGVNTFAHSGRTDSNGGHKDNQNKSGLGSYHYHCGGHPAHLHTNGVCPYADNSSSSNKNTSNSSSQSKDSKSNSSSSNTSTVNSVPPTIDVKDIQINEKIENIKVGESKNLTVTITPDNATDKSIIWRSSNEDVATISTTGELLAKKSGLVEITATCSNGKATTIKINIDEEQKDKITLTTIQNDLTTNTTTNTTSTTNNQEDSEVLEGILGLGLLGGVGYLGYKKLKKSK